MDPTSALDPAELITRILPLHQNEAPPDGMFGFPVPIVFGKFQRTVIWEKSWARCFTKLLEDVIKYDNEASGP